MIKKFAKVSKGRNVEVGGLRRLRESTRIVSGWSAALPLGAA